jgi:hypothetical protein
MIRCLACFFQPCNKLVVSSYDHFIKKKIVPMRSMSYTMAWKPPSQTFACLAAKEYPLAILISQLLPFCWVAVLLTELV